MAAVPRKQGPFTPSNTRGVLCSSCPGKMYASVLRAAAVPWLPMSAGMSQTGAVRGGGAEFAIMTRSLFSSWALLRKLSSAVIYVDIRKVLKLFEEVVGPVMGRSDRAKVMARLGWTKSEQHQLEATLQVRQHETALPGMAPDVAAMLADWHQTNWFTVQGAEKRALHFTGFVLVILPPMSCSLLLSRDFTESWLSGLGRKVCCRRSCSTEGSWMLPLTSLRRST